MALLTRPKKPESQKKLDRFLKLCAHGATAKDAALDVGWTESTGQTYRYKHRAKISELAIQRFQDEVPDAVETIAQLRHGKSEAVRLAAANRSLEGAGHGVVHKQEVVHKSDDDLVQALLQAFNGDKAQAVTFLKAAGSPIPAYLQSQTIQ